MKIVCKTVRLAPLEAKLLAKRRKELEKEGRHTTEAQLIREAIIGTYSLE